MHQRPNTIEQVDADEEKLSEVHKHPIGIIIVYIQAVIGIVTASGLILFLAPSVIEDSNQAFLIAVAFIVFAMMFTGIALAITTYIYRQSRIIVTDRNITQIIQFGLFRRKVSQLNIVNVEDVTSVQSGFVSTMFNYGVLRIETAGEQSNFDFSYCPNSGYIAKLILDAREKMLGQMDENGEALSDVKVNKTIRGRGKGKRTIAGKSSPEPKQKKRHHRRVRGLGAEMIERAHEPPDNNYSNPKTK